MSVTRIPLEVIQIPEPCPADWDAMVGDDRTRFCDGCKKHVHFLSAMTRDEAERLVCESAGELCVRMAKLADGTVLTVDYQPAADARRRGWRFWTGVGLVGALLAGLAEAAGLRSPPPAPPMGGGMVAYSAGGLRLPAGWPGTRPTTGSGVSTVAGTMPAPLPPAGAGDAVPTAADASVPQADDEPAAP